MKKIDKFADLCWDGLTLKNISEKRIVLAYVLFFIIALLFELFLFGLLLVTAILLSSYGYKPSFQYYTIAIMLIIMLMITIPLIVTTSMVHRKNF